MTIRGMTISTIRGMTSRRMTSTIRGMISTIRRTIRLVGAGTMRIETPGICHQSFRMPPRIDDLGLGELPVDSG